MVSDRDLYFPQTSSLAALKQEERRGKSRGYTSREEHTGHCTNCRKDLRESLDIVEAEGSKKGLDSKSKRTGVVIISLDNEWPQTNILINVKRPIQMSEYVNIK